LKRYICISVKDVKLEVSFIWLIVSRPCHQRNDKIDGKTKPVSAEVVKIYVAKNVQPAPVGEINWMKNGLGRWSSQ